MRRIHTTSLFALGISGLLLLTDGSAQGDASPQNFAEFCRGNLPAQRQQSFEQGVLTNLFIWKGV